MKRDWLIVDVLAGPGAEQVIVQRRAALGAAARASSTPAPASVAELSSGSLATIRRRTSSWPRDPCRRTSAVTGGRIVGIAELGLQQLLDQAGAGAAGRGCLGVGAHVIERLEPKPGDRPGDRPLQTPLQPQISASSGRAATAAAGSSGMPPCVVLAEDQRLAHVGDIGAALQMVEEPWAVRRCRRT